MKGRLSFYLQNFLIGNSKFDDLRSYGIICKIFNELGLICEKFILIFDSEKKYKALLKQGFNIQKLSTYYQEEVNVDNLSEYLVKILNNTHTYSESIIDRIMDVFGKKDKIQEFIKSIMTNLSRNVFNESVSNMNYEDENFDGYNLRFADLDTAIKEELSIYEIMKQGDN